MWSREEIAARAAAELRDGMYVNLGIGIPTLVAAALPPTAHVMLHSENGLLGMGDFPFAGSEDPDVINAGKQTVTIEPGGSVFDSAASFAMIRGGHIDVAILGALQVSQHGDLANWAVPGRMVKGMGGAMDLVAGAKRVIILTEHLDRDGASKIVGTCNLPLTGAGVVNRIISTMADFDISSTGLRLRALAPGITLNELRNCTAAPFDAAPALAGEAT